jgi:hypothetical protein
LSDAIDTRCAGANGCIEQRAEAADVGRLDLDEVLHLIPAQDGLILRPARVVLRIDREADGADVRIGNAGGAQLGDDCIHSTHGLGLSSCQ